MLMGILREPDWHGGCVYQQKYIRRDGSRSMPHLRSDIVDTHPGPLFCAGTPSRRLARLAKSVLEQSNLAIHVLKYLSAFILYISVAIAL